MPHLSPMLWSMMIVSTWFILMTISTMMFFPMKYISMSMKKFSMNKKNNWFLYSSINKL